MSLMMDSPCVLRENGVLWQGRNKSKFNQCECCPYGYHIDLDFVRYCETVTHRSDASISKERRKERRRQRQSMEVLLGLTSPTIWNLEQQLPRIEQEISTTATEDVVRDASLDQAVQDFEETLERTHKSSPVGLQESSAVYFDMPIANLGSLSNQPVSPQDVLSMTTSAAHEALLKDLDVVSISSGGSGLSHGALQDIRHQMAVSLERMRELEEQVKLIPILQVQLSVVNEEKRKMCNNHKSADPYVPKRFIHQYIQTDATETLAPKSPKSTIQLQTVSGNGYGGSPNCQGAPLKVQTRDIGLTCTVIKRDMDTMHRPIVRNATTTTEDMHLYCNFTDSRTDEQTTEIAENSAKTVHDVQLNANILKSHPPQETENLPKEPESQSTYYPLSLNSMNANTLPRVKQLSVIDKPKVPKVSTRDVSVGNYLPIEQIYTESEVKEIVAESVRAYKERSATRREVRVENVGIQVEVLEVSEAMKTDSGKPLHIIEQRDISTQVSPYYVWCQDIGIQSKLDETKRTEDRGVQVKPRGKNVAVDATVNTRDYGTQKGFACAKCDVEKRSYGTGIVPEQVPPPVIKATTKSVACNTAQKTCADKYTDTVQSTVLAKHDASTITNVLKGVDVSVGPTDVFQPIVEYYTCSECDQKVTSASKNDEEVAKTNVGDQESRIPRRMENRPFKRQITYTKLEPAKIIDLQDIVTKSSVPTKDGLTAVTSPTQSKSGCPAEKLYHQWESVPADKLCDVKEKDVKTAHSPCAKWPFRNESPVSVSSSASPVNEARPSSSKLGSPTKTGGIKDDESSLYDVASKAGDMPLALDISSVSRSPVNEASCSKLGSPTKAGGIKEELVLYDGASKAGDMPFASDRSDITDESCNTGDGDESRPKVKPSKKMQAALKVVNDSLKKTPGGTASVGKAANDIIQREWFHISSTPSANPHTVEDYLDAIEERSSALLEHVVNITDKAGNTAMHYALSQGNFDVVSILLDSKVCNINRPNAAGYTAVMLVSLAQVRSQTHRRVLQRFLGDADVNIRAKQHGQTALMLAVSHNRLDMVQLLIESGADLNIQDEDGSTALMCAAEHGHAAIVQYLINQPDADQSVKDVDGSTALDIALDAGHKDVGILLYAHKHFSRNNSPHSSLRSRRSKSATPVARTASTPPRTPSSPLPGRARHVPE